MHLALPADEESTCHSAVSLAAHIAEHTPAPRGVLVGGPTCFAPVNRHKGSFIYTINVKGRSAHASMPELGVSATALAAHLITWIDSQSARSSAASATTHSIGWIEGGSTSNIIAEHCQFEWDIRLAPQDDLNALIDACRAQAAGMLTALQTRIPEAAITIEQTVRFPGFHTPPEAGFAQECLAVSAATSHVEFSTGTEAGLFQGAGLPVIVMGPGDLT